jgi:CBS domain-containing protein
MAPTGVANDWWTVDDLVRHGPPGGERMPLVLRDWSGAPSAVLPAGSVPRVPSALRGAVRLRDLALRPDQVRTAWPDEPVLAALTRPGPEGAPLVAVEDGRIVGLVSVHDLARAVNGPAPSPRRPVSYAP